MPSISRSSRRFIFMVLASVSCLSAAAQGSSRAEQIDQIVRGHMQQQKIPGLAVAVVKNGKTLVAKGYGTANLEYRVPVTPATLFQSGSVGKQFTAVAVMLQVEDRKLALDDSLTKYFPDAPRTWEPITVRQLLTHTSGIPDYSETDIELRKDYTEEEFIRVAYTLSLEFEPGSRWSYSNTGYVLLGILVRKVSGRFYGDVLKERVFKPLKMETARIISEADIIPNRAAGYRLVDGEIKNQEWVAPSLNTTADGALYVSLKDMLAWDSGLRSGAVLRPKSWKQMYTPVVLKSGKNFPYGFGWFVDVFSGQRCLWHSGAWQGFRTYISRYIDEDLTVIVLANLADANLEPLIKGIASLFNPALAMPKPITDREPDVTAQLRALLAAAANEKLIHTDFAFAPRGFFPDTAQAYSKLLHALGPLRRLSLVQQREEGDDRTFRYEALYDARTVQVWLGLTPDKKITVFRLR